ncbi:purine-nucleoside phosphorylase [Sphingomonas montanisoli]|uniref:Purine-nucleoside phosphorylase n=1 Tax=Sphingomonas montanisoli TaxID=2606412 RepID=A0A5D9C2J9_9SPHN|nr:purine-nucleoside phosphorylase [Sphingomonas montanisoli]TZG24125.1 purine-nucleoside phosphorylase [Sphingomonas montanisoli]
MSSATSDRRSAAVFAARIILALIVGGTFALLAWRFVHRPLWIDETMAMINYPVTGFVGLFAPLPYYSQAAPPLFNLIGSAIVAMPPAIARSMLALLVIGGLAAVAWLAFRRWWAPLLVIGYPIAIPSLLIYATEFKYYGVETLGAGIVAAWFMARRSREPLRFRDIAILIAAMLCGISTMVLAALALAIAALLSWHRRGRIGAGELALGLLFGFAMIAYYAAIRFGTSIQINNYPDSYGGGGLASARRFVQAVDGILTSRGAPMILVAGAIGLGGGGPSRRVLLLSACAVTVFLILAMAGLYPASSPRHLAWLNGIALFVVLNAVSTLVAQKSLWPTSLRFAAIGVLSLLVLSTLPPALRQLRNPHAGMREANDELVAWLSAQPASAIGMWQGTQSVVQYYRPFAPAIGKHHYFGKVDQRSVAVPKALLGKQFLSQPYDRIVARIEAGRREKGGNANRVVYRLLGDYRGAARSLLSEAPRAQPFLIVASHADLKDQEIRNRLRRDGLLKALAEAHCTYQPVLTVRAGFVLRVACPAEAGQATAQHQPLQSSSV